MELIDSHVHLYPPELGASPRAWGESRAEGVWAQLCLRTRRDGRPVQTFPSVDQLLRAMDRAGVATAILQGWYWENEATCREHTRFLGACVRAHPDRLKAFAAVQPCVGEPHVLSQLREARDNGLIGVGEICPHAQGAGRPASTLLPLFSTAADWGWPVCLHVTDPESRPYPGRVETPLADFAAWAAGFPSTSFILAHWGGGLDVRALPNVWVDTAAAPLIYGPSAWERVGRTVEATHVLFGSDYPLILRPRETDEAEIASFTAELHTFLEKPAAERIGGGNVLELLTPRRPG